MFKRLSTYIILIIILGCGPEELPSGSELLDIPFNPTEYTLDIPDHFPRMIIPQDNPLTDEGVRLGRRLFYDPILSADNTMSCSSCHFQESSFTDNLAVSVGIDGIAGRRSSMSLLDIGFNNNGLFWDGRVATLEEQALIPVEDPIELHHSWPDVIDELRAHDLYPTLFREAFGIVDTSEIVKELAAKALAQFERTLISSGQSRYDQIIDGVAVFTDEELLGHNIFFDIEPDVSRHAECGHCHNAPLFTTNEYFNNGLDDTDGSVLTDVGRAEVTGTSFDNGKFRVPTLRNILKSAPYMHDGRFTTFDQVLDHYDSQVQFSRNVDPNLRVLNLSSSDRAALIAFIKTLEDPVFTSDERYQSPF